MEPLELAFTVGCPPAHAFAVWTERTSLWWPKSHSVSADPELTVTFEPREGGRVYERTPAGEEHDWGEVLEWDPPRRLAYRWHLRQDREDATRVEITFAPAGDGTAVTIVHTTGSASGSASATSGVGRAAAALRARWHCTGGPVHPTAHLRPAGPVGTGAPARLHRAMEKPKLTAPPTHRRYPRGSPKPTDGSKAETSRRWPRAISDRRVFPRG